MTVSNELYFLRVSKVWSLLIHGSVGRVRIKNLTYILTFIYLFAFFFHHKICVFIIFIFFLFDEIICVFIIFIFFFVFDEIQNSRNRILTNKKHKVMTRNGQWNCMHFFDSTSLTACSSLINISLT